jgi:hypothetical protein
VYTNSCQQQFSWRDCDQSVSSLSLLSLVGSFVRTYLRSILVFVPGWQKERGFGSGIAPSRRHGLCGLQTQGSREERSVLVGSLPCSGTSSGVGRCRRCSTPEQKASGTLCHGNSHGLPFVTCQINRNECKMKGSCRNGKAPRKRGTSGLLTVSCLVG